MTFLAIALFMAATNLLALIIFAAIGARAEDHARAPVNPQRAFSVKVKTR
jgi:hypothetical protein